jgi:hypothetical protein
VLFSARYNTGACRGYDVANLDSFANRKACCTLSLLGSSPTRPKMSRRLSALTFHTFECRPRQARTHSMSCVPFNSLTCSVETCARQCSDDARLDLASSNLTRVSYFYTLSPHAAREGGSKVNTATRHLPSTKLAIGWR